MREKDMETALKCGRTARESAENSCENLKSKEKTLNDKAAGIFLVFGCAVILLFLCFGGKNEGAGTINYANSSNAEYNGAVQAMSYVLNSGEELEKEEKDSREENNEKTENAEINSANVENNEKSSEKGWNFWEFLSQSIEKFFISKGIRQNEKSQR